MTHKEAHQLTEGLLGRQYRLTRKDRDLDRWNSPYIQRQLFGLNEATKKGQREKVVQHILDHHHKDREIRFFGLPSIQWETEYQLIESWSDGVHCIAVERVRGIFEKSVQYMPGTGRIFAPVYTRIGVVHGCESDSAEILDINAHAFFGLSRAHFYNSGDFRRRWVNKYRKWSAFWLDFTSPVCKETLTCLRRVHVHLDLTCNVIPFAITLLAARESRETSREMNQAFPGLDPVERRTQLVRSILHYSQNQPFREWKCRIDKSWIYMSRNIPMLMILGRMNRHVGVKP